MNNFILFFTISRLMISCADVFYVEEDSKEDESIEGYWFTCEFGYLEPDCIIFDDGGFLFTKDGKVYYVQEHTQMSSDECNRGPCFNYFIDTVIVER